MRSWIPCAWRGSLITVGLLGPLFFSVWWFRIMCKDVLSYWQQWTKTFKLYKFNQMHLLTFEDSTAKTWSSCLCLSSVLLLPQKEKEKHACISRLFCSALLDNYKRSISPLFIILAFFPLLSLSPMCVFVCLSLLGAFLFIIILLLKSYGNHKTACGKVIKCGT